MVPDITLLEDLRVYVDTVRNFATETRVRLVSHPGAVTAVLASVFLAYAAYRLFEPLPAGTWPVLRDSVIFEYIGWYISNGNRLYIDVFEVKPPLAFEITAVLALLGGNSVVLYHSLNLLANSAAIIVGASAAAGIVYELTDDFWGAVTAGMVPFILPFYFYRALIGFKSKYFVIAAGLGCLYLAYRKRPALAGIAGAAAVGFWQLAAVFPVVALGLCWQDDGRDGVKRFLATGLGTGAVILLPVVVWGALPAMITEVLLTPLLITEGHTFSDRVHFIVRLLGKSLPVALIGVVGIASGVAPHRFRREWPLVLVAVWFTLQMIALDFDFKPDLFPWFAVVGLGVGLVVAEGRQWNRREGDDREGGRFPLSVRALAIAMLLLAGLSVATMGGFGTGTTGLTTPDTFDVDTELDPDLPYNGTENQYVYWNRIEIPTCRVFGANTQFQLVNRIGLAEDKRWYETPCGQFGPTWRAILDEYGV